MSDISNYQSFFDKAQWSSYSKSWTVHETDTNATLTSLDIVFPGDLVSLDKSSYQGIYGSICKKLTSKFEDLDCDGFAFMCPQKSEDISQQVIIAVELKSASYEKHFMRAYRQLIYTYIKIHNLLSFCQGYSCLNHTLIGIIACHPPKAKYLSEASARRISGDSTPLDIIFIDKMYQASQQRACITIPLQQVHCLQQLQLDANLQQQKLHLYLHLTEKDDDSHSTLDLQDILNRIRP